MEKTEIILQSNGTLTERLISERDLNAEQSVLDTLTEQVTRPVRNVFHVPGWGFVHASVGRSDTLWSVPIDRIPLHARFQLINQVCQFSLFRASQSAVLGDGKTRLSQTGAIVENALSRCQRGGAW